jgi:hypothetical protein
MLKADGFDEAIIGVGYTFDLRDGLLVYSVEKMLDMLVKSGMSREDAREYYEFNILGASLKGTPIFMEEYFG